jgi:SEC-C motif-containing protein
MLLPAPNDACPCHSGRKYKKCCRRWHQGDPAPTPEALMRSRYAAYALGLVEHILRTTDPDGPHFEAATEHWREQVAAFCRSVRFEGLELLEARADGERGIVDFRARLSSDEGATVMAERSLFRKVDGCWLYHSGSRKDRAGLHTA